MVERAQGRLESWSTVATAFLLVLTLLPALLDPSKFLQDDSYFYLQIAHNIVAGQGSTFHGLTPTNGYHPLWMVLVVAAAMLADGDKTVLLNLVIVLQAALTAGMAVLYLRLARAMALDYPLVGLALVLSFLLGTSVYGSEAHLNALALTGAMLSLWNALGSDRPRHWLTSGLLCGLAVLARLDNLFVVAALGILATVQDRSGGAAAVVRRAAVAAVGGVVVVAPYLALNAWQYGHLMPISGAIKSTFPSFHLDFHRLGAMGKLAAPFGGVALLTGVFLDPDPRRRVIWCGLGTGVIVHALYVAGFTAHYTFWAWYYVSGVLAAALSASFLPGWFADRFGRDRTAVPVRALVIACTLAMVTVGAARAWLKAVNPIRLGPVVVDLPVNEYRWPEEFAPWMKQHLPPGSTVFVFDWPGALAYYSDLRIVPMDGLVNDFKYNDDLLAAGATAYLCEHHVGYFFGLIDDGRATRQVEVRAPLYRKSAGRLYLREEQLVVRTRDVVTRPDEALPFAVWRLDCPGN